QDRVLALDLIVPPKSRRIPIDAFCVEQGRWSRRGNEAVTAFSESNNALATKDLKIAAKARRSQGEVWANVGKAQKKLADKLAVARGYGVSGGASYGAGSARAEAGPATGRSSGAGDAPQASFSPPINQARIPINQPNVIGTQDGDVAR